VLNKVSEGNVEIMFKTLVDTTKQYHKNQLTFALAYSKVFIQMNIASLQQLSAILSVNCVFVAALHRLLGDVFLATVIRQLY
jgi:hypothetical protein